MRIAAPIILSEQERGVLKVWARGRKLPLRLIQRAQIVVMAAEGVPSQDIAERWEFPDRRCSFGENDFFPFVWKG
jgi:hypothetical protein